MVVKVKEKISQWIARRLGAGGCRRISSGASRWRPRRPRGGGGPRLHEGVQEQGSGSLMEAHPPTPAQASRRQEEDEEVVHHDGHHEGRTGRGGSEMKGVCRHHVLGVLASLALALGGLVEQSTTAALRALSDPMSSEAFAHYVANTSYLTSYCAAARDNLTHQTVYNNNSTEEEMMVSTSVILPTSPMLLKVPLLEEDRAAAVLRAAFLWGALLSPLPGWWLTRRAGAKRVLGWGTLAAGALSLLVPAAWGTPAHVALRVVQGAATGVMWPALQTLAATWCPRDQISLFVSSYSAWSLGCGLASMLGPPLVHGLGRDALFYVEAALTILWFTAWSLLVYNSPLSANKDKWYVAFQAQGDEVAACRESAGTAVPSERPSPAPWRHLLTSGPVWGCAVAVMGANWGHATLRLAAPKFLQLVYGFAITQEIVLTTLPHLGHFLSAITCGLLADHVIARKISTATTTRKIFVYAGHYFPGALMFVAGYTGCDPAVPAALFCAAWLASGAMPAGIFASALEIAPNYAGAVFAVCHTAGAAGGLAANYIITEGLHGSLPGSWRLVFGVASLALVSSGSCYLALGRSSEQVWNRPEALQAAAEAAQAAQEDEEEARRVVQQQREAAEQEEEGEEDNQPSGPPLHPSATQMTLVSNV